MTETTQQRPLRADAVRNRERVLAAAAVVFARHGLASTLDQVAEEAGVGVGTVYRRFSGRDELVRLVFAQRLDDVATVLEQASHADDPWSALVDALHDLVTDMAANRGLQDLVVVAADPSASMLHEVHLRLEAASDRATARAIEQGTLRPGVHGSDVGVLVRCVMAAADMTDGDGWRRYLTIFLDGLRNRPDAATLPEATIRPDAGPFPRQPRGSGSRDDR